MKNAEKCILCAHMLPLRVPSEVDMNMCDLCRRVLLDLHMLELGGDPDAKQVLKDLMERRLGKVLQKEDLLRYALHAWGVSCMTKT